MQEQKQFWHLRIAILLPPWMDWKNCLLMQKEVYQKEDAVQQEVNEAVKSLTLKVAEARLKGDVDGNGKIGTSDSVLLLQYAAEMTVLDEISAESADVNGDKAADTQDAVWILQYASEKTEQ